jgi:small-conductance mechanosensitive channel
LILSILRAVAIVAAVFAILRMVLGVNISPLLASTALVTAVVGVCAAGGARQPAGGDVPAYYAVGPAGDWVALDQIEGEVLETNWRETRLRSVAGHILIIPNSSVASAIIHNMSRPTPLRRHKLAVGASYSDAPGEVIAALVESALAVPEVLRASLRLPPL